MTLHTFSKRVILVELNNKARSQFWILAQSWGGVTSLTKKHSVTTQKESFDNHSTKTQDLLSSQIRSSLSPRSTGRTHDFTPWLVGDQQQRLIDTFDRTTSPTLKCTRQWCRIKLTSLVACRATQELPQGMG